VNTAPAEEIAKQLNGIGTAKAEAIVSYRTQNGAFKTLQDLTKVKGIGAATVDKNRDNIEFDAKP
jgi:competence protein ComEA